jgi:4'-phosphopantetheinyl transferase
MERLAKARVAGAVEVVTARLDLACEAVAALSACLCEAERQRATRFHAERDRRRFIVARARLRELLAERVGLAAQSLELTYGKNGKPALAGRPAHTGWGFNLSHCDELAVYGFARGIELGVDVEAIRAVREADAIAARCFSPGENRAYRALAPQDRMLGFFRCWTRKEAFVKALGDGLSVPLAEVDVSLPPSGWRLHSFSPLPGFIAALATHHG